MNSNEQLATLQSALLDGKIDRATYETLKSDLLELAEDPGAKDGKLKSAQSSVLEDAELFLNAGNVVEALEAYEKFTRSGNDFELYPAH